MLSESGMQKRDLIYKNMRSHVTLAGSGVKIYKPHFAQNSGYSHLSY